MKGISQVICTGPADLDSPYGGIFFYGVHIVQPLMYIFGEDIERVKVSRNGSYGNASLRVLHPDYLPLLSSKKKPEDGKPLQKHPKN
jgi:hypothetical protein